MATMTNPSPSPFGSCHHLGRAVLMMMWWWWNGWWLGCILIPSVEAASSGYVVLLRQATGVISRAYGPVQAKIASDGKITIQFSIVAKAGSYEKGAITALTDTNGRLVSLTKSNQVCTLTYAASGQVNKVQCAKTRKGKHIRRIEAIGVRDEDETPVNSEAELGFNEASEKQEKHPMSRRLVTCAACRTKVKATFQTGVAVMCGSVAGLVPAEYAWAKDATSIVCALGTKLGTPTAIAGKVCSAGSNCDQACESNDECPSGVCSAGLCISSWIADGKPCPDYEYADCRNGVCARGGFPNGKTICCPNWHYVYYESRDEYYCQAIQKNGEPCEVPEICISGVCSNKVCVPGLIADGKPCPDYEDIDCRGARCARGAYPSGERICCRSWNYVYSPIQDDWYCMSIQPNGKFCDSNEICMSGICKDGKCQG